MALNRRLETGDHEKILAVEPLVSKESNLDWHYGSVSGLEMNNKAFGIGEKPEFGPAGMTWS